jgi:hypothetical protein
VFYNAGSNPIFIVQLYGMRHLLFIGLILFATAANAQTVSTSKQKLADVQVKDSTMQKKWFISKYSGLSAGFVAFKGGSATIFSAPMGVQLNRMLNNNVYAFAGLEIAPSYINFNQRFVHADFTKTGFSNTFMAGNRSQFSVNPAAYIGVGYTNDARTFQIQARMGVQNANSNYFTDPSDFRNLIGLERQVPALNPTRRF